VKIHELPTNSKDMPAALERATAALIPLRKAVATAEERVIAARAEVERLARKTAAMRQAMNGLHVLCREQKEKAMAAAACEDPAAEKRAWSDYGQTRVAAVRSRESSLFLTAWIAPDADLRLLEAELAERKAVADLHEGLATAKRAELLVAMGPAAAIDSGLGVDLIGTQSQKLLDRCVQIRRDEIPRIEAAIRDHRRRVAAERDSLAPGLFAVTA